jgi:glucose-1-phosphate thymidylyltransferase
VGSPGKTDILEYYGSRLRGADIAYVVQPNPRGLCDAIFRALPLIGKDESVVIGLPDTVWLPEYRLGSLPDDVLSFLLFDAVVTDESGNVEQIRVKKAGVSSGWIWGAIKMPGTVFHALHQIWRRPDRGDEYFGTLVNCWLAEGGRAVGVRAGRHCVDVGTPHGYRAALHLLAQGSRDGLDVQERAAEASHAPAESDVDAVGVHGFPLDWNHWQIAEWPDRVREAAAVTGKPVWVTEVGASSFGAEEVQVFALDRTLELLKKEPERIYWYSLFDRPASWPAETRHKEAVGSAITATTISAAHA